MEVNMTANVDEVPLVVDRMHHQQSTTNWPPSLTSIFAATRDMFTTWMQPSSKWTTPDSWTLALSEDDENWTSSSSLSPSFSSGSTLTTVTSRPTSELPFSAVGRHVSIDDVVGGNDSIAASFLSSSGGGTNGTAIDSSGGSVQQVASYASKIIQTSFAVAGTRSADIADGHVDDDSRANSSEVVDVPYSNDIWDRAVHFLISPSAPSGGGVANSLPLSATNTVFPSSLSFSFPSHTPSYPLGSETPTEDESPVPSDSWLESSGVWRQVSQSNVSLTWSSSSLPPPSSSWWLDWLSNATTPDYGFVDVSGVFNVTQVSNFTNLTMGEEDNWRANVTGPSLGTDIAATTQATVKEYWALVLILFPLFTVFGNVLVILSVYKERNLHTVTNYFIVSLAVADLLVAALVMPFAVYFLVNASWELSPTVCDFYIAMDVTCSTSSIFNLVAISIDRYIAVTQPIKYAKHKSNQRVVLTIAIVWIVSAAIGSPIVLGLNTSPDRDPMLCMFYNPDFIIYSSLSSFYIPCIIMVFLYYRIFKAIHARAKKSAAAKKAHRANLRPDTIIENVAHSKHLQGPGNKKGRNVLCRYKETVTLCVSLEPDHPTTNTESGSQENEEEEAEVEELCPNTDCHVIRNDKSTEFILGPVSDDGRLSAALTTTSTSAPSTPFPMSEQKALLEHNGSHDSGYGLSNMEETTFQVAVNEVTLASPKDLERSKRGGSVSSHHKRKSSKRNGTVVGVQGSGVGTGVPTLGPSGGGADTTDGVNYNESETGCEVRRTPDGHLSPGERRKKPRFHLVRTHKSSRKKREKSAAKKERKATKTLAIVLGVFLACWVPFFTCNMVDAICIKLSSPEWQPGVTAFVLTTWLGYMNSFINPVIYTIFNPEFRKAFKKILFGT